MVGARPSRRLALLKGSHFPAGRNARAEAPSQNSKIISKLS